MGTRYSIERALIWRRKSTEYAYISGSYSSKKSGCPLALSSLSFFETPSPIAPGTKDSGRQCFQTKSGTTQTSTPNGSSLFSVFLMAARYSSTTPAARLLGSLSMDCCFSFSKSNSQDQAGSRGRSEQKAASKPGKTGHK